MTKNKWAIIDDIRELNCDFIAKTGVDGIRMLKEHFDEIQVLCMDHDLGDPHEMNGYDVLKSLVLRNLLPDEVQLVTSNPVGKKNMSLLLKDNGFESSDGTNFKRTE